MLKGVSQKVIEVVHTDNRYFEKAILFLRPNVQGEDRADLNAQKMQLDGSGEIYRSCLAGGRCSLCFFPAVTRFFKNRADMLAHHSKLCYNKHSSDSSAV